MISPKYINIIARRKLIRIALGLENHLGLLYSADYNLIELVWHSAKEYIANRLFKSIEELEFLLHKLLNEGGLVIKWGRKLKNKGNAVITI